MVRGSVVLVRDDREVGRWPLDLPGTTVDLATVDYLSRLQLTVKRLACEIRLAHLCPRLRELLDLAGLGHWVEAER